MVNFEFYFEKLSEEENEYITDQGPSQEKYVIRFNLRSYGQKCKYCSQFGSGLILESNLDDLLNLYRNIINKVYNESQELTEGMELNQAEKYGYLADFQKLSGNGTTSHRDDLCEAC